MSSRFDPKWRGRNWLNAYYYSFRETGCGPVDAILAAVAHAGKAYHHTDQWDDEPPFGFDETCIESIQRMAQEAARDFTSIRADARARYRDEVVAWLRERADELDDERRAQRLRTGRNESNSVREKKRAQAREVRRIADRLAAGEVDDGE